MTLYPVRQASRHVAIPPADPAALRARYHLSQAEFAELLNISIRTLQKWEQGERTPTGPALTLLRVVAEHPEVFDLECK